MLGSSVVDGEQQVDRDARLIIGYSACGTRGDVTLLRDGVPVDSEITYGAAGLPSVWASVKPRAPLQVSASYTLKLTTERGSSTTVFTAGSDLAIKNDEKPSVAVVSSMFTSPANSAGFAAATFELELRRPASLSTTARGGVLFLNGKAPSKEFWTFSTEALVFDPRSSSVRVTTARGVRPHEPTCFFAVYEDGAGRASAGSEPTCVTIPGDPPIAAQEDASSTRSREGCSASSSSPRVGAPWWLVLGAGVMIALRRLPRGRVEGREPEE